MFAFLLFLPPICRLQSPRREHFVGGPVTICHLFHHPPPPPPPRLWQRCTGGPAYYCFSALFASVMVRGPSSKRALRRRPSYHLPFVSFAHLYGGWPEWASLSFAFLRTCYLWTAAWAGQLVIAQPERASLSFAFMPDLRRSTPRVKALQGRGWRGGGGLLARQAVGLGASQTVIAPLGHRPRGSTGD